MKFTALQTSKVSDETLNDTLDETLNRQDGGLDGGLADSKVPKYHDDTLNDTLDDTLEHKVLAFLKEYPKATQVSIAQSLGCSVPSVKRITKELSDSGKIVREGGKRYGHWKVL